MAPYGFIFNKSANFGSFVRAPPYQSIVAAAADGNCLRLRTIWKTPPCFLSQPSSPASYLLTSKWHRLEGHTGVFGGSYLGSPLQWPGAQGGRREFHSLTNLWFSKSFIQNRVIDMGIGEPVQTGTGIRGFKESYWLLQILLYNSFVIMCKIWC